MVEVRGLPVIVTAAKNAANTLAATTLR